MLYTWFRSLQRQIVRACMYMCVCVLVCAVCMCACVFSFHRAFPVRGSVGKKTSNTREVESGGDIDFNLE